MLQNGQSRVFFSIVYAISSPTLIVGRHRKACDRGLVSKNGTNLYYRAGLQARILQRATPMPLLLWMPGQTKGKIMISRKLNSVRTQDILHR